MNLLGYKGNYPNFYKDGEILRPHLAKSYETVYLVGREKNVKHIVHCFESCDKESLNIFLLCGTALLKKGEEATDIISCLFNAKGRRIFSGISQYIPFEDYEKNILFDTRYFIFARIQHLLFYIRVFAVFDIHFTERSF